MSIFFTPEYKSKFIYLSSESHYYGNLFILAMHKKKTQLNRFNNCYATTC